MNANLNKYNIRHVDSLYNIWFIYIKSGTAKNDFKLFSESHTSFEFYLFVKVPLLRRGSTVLLNFTVGVEVENNAHIHTNYNENSPPCICLSGKTSSIPFICCCFFTIQSSLALVTFVTIFFCLSS